MAAEIDKRVPFARVDGFTHQEIQGVLATTPGNPFREGHIPEFSIVRIKGGRNRSRSPIREVTKSHGRAFEYSKGVIWEDNHGNLYCALNIKGNNAYEQSLFATSVSPSGFLPYGLQEGDAMVRILRASEVLRSNNVPTEAIIKVIEPGELPFGKDVVSQEEFKARVIKSLVEGNSSKSKKRGFTRVEKEQLPAVALALENMTFFFTVRGLQTQERVHDLFAARDYESLKLLLSPAFSFINLEEEKKAKALRWYKPKYLSVDKKSDVRRYLLEDLPERIARSYALLHQSGLVHGIGSHYGNISSIGSIYDLDTVRGEPLGLGDKKMDIFDFFNDFAYLTSYNVEKNPKLLREVDPEFLLIFTRNLLLKYFEISKTNKIDLNEILGPDFDISVEDYVKLIIIDGMAFSHILVEGANVPPSALDRQSLQNSFFQAFGEYIFNNLVSGALARRAESPSQRGQRVLSSELKALRVFGLVLAGEFMARITTQMSNELQNPSAFLEKVASANPHEHKFIDLISRGFFQQILKKYGLDKKGTYNSPNPSEFFSQLGAKDIFEQNRDAMLGAFKKLVTTDPKELERKFPTKLFAPELLSV